MVLGQTNSASLRTFLDASSVTGLIGFQCNVTGSSSLALYGATAGGIGVQGSDYGKPTGEVGLGVYGTSDLGNGVKAVGGSNGVWGIGGDTGAGVLAQNQGTGAALQVEGTASFSRSGVVLIAAGNKSIEVGGVSLSADSLVLANLQNCISGVNIEAVVPSIIESSFEIFLSRPIPKGQAAKIGWFVVN
jgi:hypothetical protein